MSSSFKLQIVCVALALAGCSAGTGDGLDPNGRPLDEGGATGGPLSAEFKSIQDNVFTPLCTTCHSSAGAPQGLRLDSTSSYSLLVGVRSQQDPATFRVQAGNPDASYLIQKLEGTAAVGARMPLGGPYLDQAEIQFLRQWIIDGAQPAQDPGPPTSVPATVNSMSPLPGSVLTEMPGEIMAIFSKDMTAASLTDVSFVVDGSGGDGTFTDGNEVSVTAASVQLSASNPRSATFRVANPSSMPADTYRVTLVGTGGAPVTDIDGLVLDGDNDGAAGGDYAMTFRFDQAPTAATWRSIQDRIFTPVCIACHAGASAPQGLKLDEANSYDLLVNVASGQVPSLMRVMPFDAASSYLIQKLEGTAAVGEQMPRGGTPLSQADIDIVREWITAGAPRTGTSPSDPTAPTVTLLNPGATLGGTVTLSAEASDDVGVTEVRFFVDATLIGSDASQPYTMPWDTTAVSDGSHTLTAEASDAAGNTTTSAAITVAVQNGPGGIQATWRSIQDNVFTPICTQCHVGANAPEGLRLDEANSYDMLVNVRSEQSSLFRVEPGNPNRSYLIQKVEGTAADGERMPLGLPPLPTETIEAMRQWVADGAER